MDATNEIDSLIKDIRRMTARVPSSVNAGSHGVAVTFKKVALDAQREMTKSRPVLAKLKQARNALAAYY